MQRFETGDQAQVDWHIHGTTGEQPIDRLAHLPYRRTLHEFDLKAYVENRLDKRMRVYLRPRLLIVDEVCYLPLDPLTANLFFQSVSARYEKRSMILTSNKNCEWGH